MHIVFFSWNGLVLDCPIPVGMMVIGQYYGTVVQNEVRSAFCHKQQELLEHGVIFLQDNATPRHHPDVQNLVQCWGGECEVLAHRPYFSYFTPCDYTLCLHMWKNIFRVNDLNEKISTELQLIIYLVDGKGVWTLPVVTLCRGHICSFILYFVITIKSCTKLLKWPA